MDYILVDTLRVPRETFAQIVEAWRDGYAGIIGETTPIQANKRRCINQMIANMRTRTLMLYDGPGRECPVPITTDPGARHLRKRIFVYTWLLIEGNGTSSRRRYTETCPRR